MSPDRQTRAGETEVEVLQLCSSGVIHSALSTVRGSCSRISEMAFVLASNDVRCYLTILNLVRNRSRLVAEGSRRVWVMKGNWRWAAIEIKEVFILSLPFTWLEMWRGEAFVFLGKGKMKGFEIDNFEPSESD